MKIKKGDSVIVIAGKDKGKTGTVEATFKDSDKVVVAGVNIITKHQKSRQRGSQGQVIEREAPVHVSNVALVVDGKPSRIGYKVEGDKKVRFAKKTGKTI